MITRSDKSGTGDISLPGNAIDDSTESAKVGEQRHSDIEALVATSHEILPKLTAALAFGRADAVSRLANLLKGAARRADCTQVYNIAALLESMGVSDDLGGAQVTLAMLRRELEKAL